MDSDSSKSRIDQFYVSKKRKHQSPNLKSGRSEKNVKVTGERSPGDKGTLDSYLKASPSEKNVTTSGLQARQEAFTKKLDFEACGPSRVVKPLSVEPSKGFEGYLRQNGSQVLCKEGVATDGVEYANEKYDSDLRDFATGFLSLYCSGVKAVAGLPPQKKTNELKRPASSSLIAHDIQLSQKRRCDSEYSPLRESYGRRDTIKQRRVCGAFVVSLTDDNMANLTVIHLVL